MKSGRLRIRTPEGILFTLPLAGPVSRFLAWLLDLACISAIGGLAATVAGWMGVFSVDIAAAFATVAYFAVSIGYGIVTEWFWRGQTIGKRLLKLRVLDEQGLRLTFSQIVVRNLLRFVDALPVFYLVGGAAVLASRRAQRLGDYAANTVVRSTSLISIRSWPASTTPCAATPCSRRACASASLRRRPPWPCSPSCAATVSIRRRASSCSATSRRIFEPSWSFLPRRPKESPTSSTSATSSISSSERAPGGRPEPEGTDTPRRGSYSLVRDSRCSARAHGAARNRHAAVCPSPHRRKPPGDRSEFDSHFKQ